MNHPTMEDLLSSVNSKILSLRSLIRIITDDKFKEAYEACSQERKDEILRYIMLNDKCNINKWLRNELSELNIFELRDKAKELGVYNYTKLTKATLILEIRQCQENLKCMVL